MCKGSFFTQNSLMMSTQQPGDGEREQQPPEGRQQEWVKQEFEMRR